MLDAIEEEGDDVEPSGVGEDAEERATRSMLGSVMGRCLGGPRPVFWDMRGIVRGGALRANTPRSPSSTDHFGHVFGAMPGLARLRHDNVVLVYDSDFADLQIDNVRVPCLFIVMEYIEGPHLRAWIANQRPTALAIIDAFLDAGKGLAAAHAKAIYHRDVKPANIVIDRQTARMVDFGLARQVPEGSDDDARTTQYGITMGTLTTTFSARSKSQSRSRSSSDER